jgi:hypothetical protein
MNKQPSFLERSLNKGDSSSVEAREARSAERGEHSGFGGKKDSRFCSLVPGIRVRDVADACRSAGLGFAWSAHHGWGRRELAQWLVGPYAHAAGATRALRSSGVRRAVTHRPLEEETIAQLLGDARAEVLEALRNAWTWPADPGFARARVDEGLVAGIVDESSDIGYAPIDGVGMRLVDRVRSLFIADYLTRPDDYAAFAVCENCEGATFDGAIYHVECARPRQHTVLRRRLARSVLLPKDYVESDADDEPMARAIRSSGYRPSR